MGVQYFQVRTATVHVPASAREEWRLAMHCVMRMLCWCATQENAQKKHFSFRCHRSDPVGSQPQEVYSVNSICFNDAYKTFATCGSDGQYNFWDKQNKQRLKQVRLSALFPSLCKMESIE